MLEPQADRMRRHATVAGHVPGHVADMVRAAARVTGHRSISSYVAETMQAAALEDLSSEGSEYEVGEVRATA